MAGEGEDDLIVTIEDGGDDGTNNESQVVIVDTTGVTDTTKGRAEVRKQLPDDPVETLRAQLAEKSAEVEKLSGQVSSAHSLVSQATQRATQAERNAAAARAEAAQSTRGTVEAGIAAAEADHKAAGDAFESAFEAGDKKAMREAQERIAAAAADLAMLRQAKAELPDPKTLTERRPTDQQAAADPIMDWVNSRTDRTKNWLLAHMDIVRDPKKNAKMQAAHYDAEAEGIALDTDEYFAHVERHLGLTKAPAADPKTDPKPANGADPQPQRRPSTSAAPVTNTGGGLNGGKRSISLTPGEAAAATDGVTHIWNYDDPSPQKRFKKGDPIGLQEMARRKERLMKEGRYHNVNIDGT